MNLIYAFFVLIASCYLLFMLGEKLETTGAKIGQLARIPEDVIASTLNAMATSGPEIIMAILAATPFIASNAWVGLELGEKASSGALNMIFSAMDNLLGIGAVAIIFLVYRGQVRANESIKVEESTLISLFFYTFASGFLALAMYDSILTVEESWALMVVGAYFVYVQVITAFKKGKIIDNLKIAPRIKNLTIHSFIYCILVFGMIVFVKECLMATFNLASIGVASVGGILILFTSYVSSFPEFVMSYRYAVANKKSELLGMLFGSNVIDLAFVGFRSIWTGENIHIYTTGTHSDLLPYYINALPIVAGGLLVGLMTKKIKWGHAYPLVAFYLMYVVSGFILL